MRSLLSSVAIAFDVRVKSAADVGVILAMVTMIIVITMHEQQCYQSFKLPF